MLFCIQIEPLKEKVTEAEIKEIIPMECCSACFHLERRIQRKFHGKWRVVNERFMPTYIFVETPNLDRCYFWLKRVPALTSVVGLRAWYPATNGLKDFRSLTEDEEKFIWLLTKGEKSSSPGIVDISRVEIKEGDKIRVLDGPLKGLKGQIRKFDLHRRQAIIEAFILGRKMEFRLGIEIVGKSAKDA